MGLYRANDVSAPINARKKRYNTNSSIEDPNSSVNLRKSVEAGDETLEAPNPVRKRLVDMTLDEQIETAKERILDWLTYTPRTSSELREKLENKGFKTIAIDAAIERLTEVGILDDSKFAADWAYSRFHYAGKAPYSIGLELQRKGLSQEIIDEALLGYSDEETLREKAVEIATAKATSLGKTKAALDYKDSQKIAAALARKGFPPGLCFEVAKEIISNYEGGDI